MAATKAVHECLFCPQTFDSATEKDDHVLEHFAQETCAECNQHLIRIGNNLYTLHNAATCDSLKTQLVVCKRQSLSDDEEDHGDISAFPEEDLVGSTDVKTEPVAPIAQVYDIPDSDDMSEEIEVELESFVKYEDETVWNEFEESRECDYDDERVENVDFKNDSHNLLDVQIFEKHLSSIQKKYSGYFECPICNKKKTKIEYVRAHMKWVHDPSKKFKCAHCRNVFMAESSAKNHLPQCKRRKELDYGDEIREDDIFEIHGTTDLETYNKYWSSLPTDADTGKFECPMCEKLLGNWRSLLKHMRYQHDPRHTSFRCVHCHMVYSKESSLEEHLQRCKHKKEESIINSDDEPVSNEFEESLECDNGNERAENLVFNNDRRSLLDVKTFEKHLSRVKKKYSSYFECPICNKKKTKIQYVRAHMKWVHDPSKKFKCAHCRNVFMAESSAKNHLPQCKRRKDLNYGDEIREDDIFEIHGTTDLETYNKYWSSLPTDADTGKFECPMCKKLLGNWPNLLKHMKYQHDPRHTSFRCVYCRIVFAREISLENHLQRCEHKKDFVPKMVTNQFECPICKSKLAKMDYLRTHIRRVHVSTKTPNKLHICFICVTIFQSEMELTNHKQQCQQYRKRNPIVEQYECYVCKHILKTLETLRVHFKNAHASNETNIKCDLCESVCSNKQSYQTHRYFKHRRTRQFICSICGRTCKSPGQLKIHERSHSGIKSFKCSYKDCNSSFSSKNNLDVHIRTHTGERPYKCSVNGCDESFISLNKCDYHKYSVHRISNFVCKICSKVFYLKLKLKEHERKVHQM